MLRILVLGFAVLLALPAQALARNGWTCAYAKQQLILTHPMSADKSIPAAWQAATAGVSMKGSPTLVIALDFNPDGPRRYADGRYIHRVYVRDEGATLDQGNGDIGLGDLLVNRVKPDGRREGMFMRPRPITEGLGRELSTDAYDLFAQPPQALRFQVNAPSVHVTFRYYLTVPPAGFADRLENGLAKTQTATDATLRAC